MPEIIHFVEDESLGCANGIIRLYDRCYFRGDIIQNIRSLRISELSLPFTVHGHKIQTHFLFAYFINAAHDAIG